MDVDAKSQSILRSFGFVKNKSRFQMKTKKGFSRKRCPSASSTILARNPSGNREWEPVSPANILYSLPADLSSPSRERVSEWRESVALADQVDLGEVNDTDSSDDDDSNDDTEDEFLSACSSFSPVLPLPRKDSDSKESESRCLKLYHSVTRFVEGERTYLVDLRALSEVYFTTLERNKMLEQEQVWVVTRNVEELVIFQSRLLESLELIMERLEIAWNEDLMRENELSIAVCRIARYFISQETNFEVYREFCAKHLKAAKLLSSIGGTSEWASFEKSCEKQIKFKFPLSSLPSLRLEDFVIKPVQKICRYGLLFEQFAKYAHPIDVPLITQAMGSMREVAMKVNSGMEVPAPASTFVGNDQTQKEEEGDGKKISRWPSVRINMTQSSSNNGSLNLLTKEGDEKEKKISRWSSMRINLSQNNLLESSPPSPSSTSAVTKRFSLKVSRRRTFLSQPPSRENSATNLSQMQGSIQDSPPTPSIPPKLQRPLFASLCLHQTSQMEGISSRMKKSQDPVRPKSFG